jgi:uncharacterized C2H2 Zn-finger protein
MIIEKYWEVTKNEWFRTALLLYIFITILGICTVLLLPGYWYFWLLLFIVALALILEQHAKNFAYRCPRCGKVFEISALENLLRPAVVNKKYLKCPICRRMAWAEILRIKKHPVLRSKLLSEEQNNTDYEKGKG